MTPRRALPTLIAAVVGLTGLGACTVPTHDEPVAIQASVPENLLEPTTTTSTTTPDVLQKQVVVYLLRSEDGATTLQPVTRLVDLSADVQGVLANLFAQRPSDDRPAERGLSTAIPESATLLSATRAESDREQLIVDVRGLFGSIQGVDLRNALAQIVWTATAPGTDVEEVVFRNDGAPVQALVDDLESTDGPVDELDYSRQN